MIRRQSLFVSCWDASYCSGVLNRFRDGFGGRDGAGEFRVPHGRGIQCRDYDFANRFLDKFRSWRCTIETFSALKNPKMKGRSVR